jgi:hypothetical protein
VGQSHDKVWRDGRLPDRAANAIGSKVFSGHGCCSFWDLLKMARF